VKAHWKDEPDEHDFPAASDYLSLVMPTSVSARRVRELRRRPIEHRKAKDLLRASRLPLLGRENVHVAKDLQKLRAGKKLSPVLLVRGHDASGAPLVIADGYHRICASYLVDENEDIPCRIAG
jgi:hypothetical protein